jgi:hypothetical protein
MKFVNGNFTNRNIPSSIQVKTYSKENRNNSFIDMFKKLVIKMN